MQKALVFVAGVITGIAASFAGVFFMASMTGDSEEKRFAQSLVDRNVELQNKLGMQCNDGVELIKNYLGALKPVMVTLQSGTKISQTDPLITQGERVREVLFTCSMVHNNATGGGVPSPTPMVLINAQGYVSAITLTVAQSSAEWCEAKCISDSLAKLQELRSMATIELSKAKTK